MEVPTWAPVVGQIELTERVPRASGVRPWLRAGAVALLGACVVAVVAAGRSDEPTAVRAVAPPAPPSPWWPSAMTESGSDPDGDEQSLPEMPSAPPLTPPATPGPDPSPSATPVAVPPAVATTTTLPAPLPLPAAPPAPPADVGSRPVPPAQPVVPPPGPATAYPTAISPAGYLATDVGCASGTSAAALDAFFRERVGPVLGHDYQHVYDLGGDRRLWLFQDTFIDHTGNATRLDQASFAHNTAMVQTGRCFSLLHRGTAAAPLSFEPGTGTQILSRWFWPLGGEVADGRLDVFWVEMGKTADPRPPDGLGWVPVRTWLATYDTATLARTSFRPAPAAGVHPIYGYAVASDATHTYLFGNSFDQNLARQGGYRACPCSATAVYLARVPRGGARHGSRVPHRGRLERRSGGGRADRQPLPRREPDAAAVPRRSLGRGHQGRRVLGRRPGHRRR